MNKYFPQILSDTTFQRVELSGGDVKIEGELYTTEKIVIEFIGQEACQVFARWNLPSSIEGVLVSQKSKLLTETVNSLKEYNRPTGDLYSFQVIGNLDKSVMEVIARSIKINGELVDISALSD